MMYSCVSSAYITLLMPCGEMMSWSGALYITNLMGPATEPLRISTLQSGRIWYRIFHNNTLIYLNTMQTMKEQCHRESLAFRQTKRLSNIWWSIVSNSAVMSNKIRKASWCWSMARNKSLLMRRGQSQCCGMDGMPTVSSRANGWNPSTPAPQ